MPFSTAFHIERLLKKFRIRLDALDVSASLRFHPVERIENDQQQ